MNRELKNKKILWTNVALLILFVSFSGTNVFAAQAMVVNAVKGRDVRAATDKLAPQIGELETQYVYLQNKITLENAYALGFQDADSEFLNSAPLGKSVSIRNEIQ